MVANRFLEDLAQPDELVLAADHRRIQPTRVGRRSGHDCEQSPRVHRLRATLQLERLELLDEDRVAHEPVRLFSEQDLAWAGGGLQALSERNRLTCGKGVPLRRIACHDLAGVDAGPHPQLEAVLSLKLHVQLAQRLAQLRGRPHRTQRVVLVEDRDPERGHDRVADELLHGAAVVLEHAADLDEVARDDVPVGLRVEPLAERRRTDQIGEHDRHRLAHFALRRALPERGSTCEAEPCAGWVGLATAGTGGHFLF